MGTLPRIPGHEVVGVVDELGEGVHGFQKGDLVGIGWFGGHCGECSACLGDEWVCCEKMTPCGVAYDGGYAEYMVAPRDAFAKVPSGLTPEEAGPLMCAGITTFNALRNCGAKPGSVVVVQGVGGLGHLGIQFAKKLGFEVVAVSSGKDKEELAKKLGAHHYVDATDTKQMVEQIKKLGGARVILITAPNAKATEDLIPALGPRGQLLVAAVMSDPITVPTIQMLPTRQSLIVWASGDSRDSEATLKFSALTGVKPMVEIFSLDKAPEAYQRMLSNKARFRCVLKISD